MTCLLGWLVLQLIADVNQKLLELDLVNVENKLRLSQQGIMLFESRAR